MGRVELYLFFGALFSNWAPTKVDEGVEVYEGNPIILMYFDTLVYFGFGQIRGEGAGVDKGTSAPYPHLLQRPSSTTAAVNFGILVYSISRSGRR